MAPQEEGRCQWRWARRRASRSESGGNDLIIGRRSLGASAVRAGRHTAPTGAWKSRQVAQLPIMRDDQRRSAFCDHVLLSGSHLLHPALRPTSLLFHSWNGHCDSASADIQCNASLRATVARALPAARLSTNFADIQSRFSAGAPWLENAIQRLGHLDVSRDCLRRFHRVYQAVLPKYRSANGLMADIAARLEHAITEFCDQAEESLSRDDEVTDLTGLRSRMTPPSAGPARARAGPLPTGQIISMATPAVTALHSVSF